MVQPELPGFDFSQLMKNENVPEIIVAARNITADEYNSIVIQDKNISIRTEGIYPLVDIDRNEFECHIIRSISRNAEAGKMWDGKFRILYNQHTGDDVKIIVDTSPIFLSEIRTSLYKKTQQDIRNNVAQESSFGYLVQPKATDNTDAEFRYSEGGQKDIYQEEWFGKVLILLKEFPGITAFQASEILQSLGYSKNDIDTEFIQNFISAYFHENNVNGAITVEYTNPYTTLEAFLLNDTHHRTEEIDSIPQYDQDRIRSVLHQHSSFEVGYIEVSGEEYEVQQVIQYPVSIEGVVFQASLWKLTNMNHGLYMDTFRVLSSSTINNTNLRIQSVNIYTGDVLNESDNQFSHCIERARNGESMCIIQVRDQDGSGRGEKEKGGVYFIQRELDALGYTVSYDTAVRAFHWGSKPVDKRRYQSTSALIKVLGITKIKQLITLNPNKIKAVREVVQQIESISAS